MTVTAIQLDSTELELHVGETYEFKVEHTPKEAKTPAYEWNCYSNNPYGLNACEIDQNGKITAINLGTSIVRVQTSEIIDMTTGKPLTSECKVKVIPIEIEKLTMNKTEATLNGGETLELSVEVSPKNATENYSIHWASSDITIAKVTRDLYNQKKAKVTVEGEGEVIITASVGSTGNVSASCNIKVLPTPLEGINFTETEKSIIMGESFELVPQFKPQNATNKNIKWTSSDEKIATVNDEGTVTTLAVGECEIKAITEDGGYEAICKVTVKPIPVESIEFKNRYYNVEIGGEKKLEVIIKPENAGNKNIKWTSSNPQIAKIDETGLVKGNTKGDVTITATTEDGGYEASCTVYVVEINTMMDVYFPTGSVMIINGYYTGQINCAIRNGSSRSVKLTKFEIIDTYTYKTVAETEDEALLGVLNPGETKSVGGNIKSVYEPIFKWTFEYNGRTYTTFNSYSNQLKSAKINSIEIKGKAEKLFPITKK